MADGFIDDGTGPQTNTDSRTTTQPKTKTATLTGGTGGTIWSGANPVRTVKPFTGAPFIPSAPPKVVAPTPTPIVNVEATTTPQPTTEAPANSSPKPLPAKDPQPAMPTIPAPIKTNIGVNSRRYNVGSDSWEINAKPEGVGSKPNINPLRFDFGRRPELKPLLRVDGVVVHVGEHYLVSPQTLADIRDAGNPHYDVVANGRILGTTMGKTVPIIEVNIAGLEATGSRRDIVNNFAGVKSVDYVYETPTIMGVPEGILEQINYTLDPNTQRPEDAFEIWQMNLIGDYSIEKLKTDTAQADGKLDKEKLAAFTKGVGERLKLLQKDLNVIKGIFYRGELAEADRKAYIKLVKRAMTDNTEEEVQKPETSTYVVKTTEVIDHQATPNSTQPAAAATTGDSTTPVALPETVTSPTDGQIPLEINTAGLERAKLLNDWNSYGFTPAEKAELKATTPDRPPYITATDGKKIGIGGVRWNPTIADKARVILPYTQRPESITIFTMSSTAASNLRRKWTEYYGIAPNRFDMNKQRIGELLNLTTKIKELEIAEGKPNY